MNPLRDVTVDQWDTQVNLNARGTFLLTKAVLPHLAKNSRIVNLSSAGARQSYVGSSVYNGTKSMIESFTRCWALYDPQKQSPRMSWPQSNKDRELGRDYGCTVNAISPGPTKTDGFNQSDPAFLTKIQPMLDATPMGSRMGKPEECAWAIAFLCEERSRWITGACLSVNGGFLMICS